MRTARYREVDGEQIAIDGLGVTRARDFALLVESGASPNAVFIECRRRDQSEIVIVELRSTVPQQPKVDIRRTERIALEFRATDSMFPDARALRADFPRERVLHLNRGIPLDQAPSLCLFAEPWPDVRLRLTANELLFRLQSWLSDTARGTNHRPNQPLEAAFIARPTPLIISPRVLDQLMEQTNVSLDLGLIRTPAGEVFIQRRDDRPVTGETPPALVLPLISKPHEHNILNDAPQNLQELHDQLAPFGINLVDAVQEKLLSLGKGIKDYGFLVLLILLLRQRSEDSEPEPELIAFFCVSKDARDKGLAGVFREVGFVSETTFDPLKRGQDVPVIYMSVIRELTPSMASFYSGHSASDLSLLGVGGGALGSQLVNDAVRGGLAKWTIVDNDILLPHNLVRHALPGYWLGHAKAEGVAFQANSLFDEPKVKPIVADILQPSEEAAGQLGAAMSEANAIVDLSASVAVARYLAVDVDSPSRRCSVFINPSGRDMVFLGEDSGRGVRLDMIEAQYYRAIVADPALSGHLLGGSTIGSCRDITSQVSQDMMGVHAALGSRALLQWLNSPNAEATVVRANPEGLGFQHCSISIGSPIEVGSLDGWKIITDSLLLATLREQRAQNLPNETGGVLLAHVDAQRRTLYVCHQIPAPPDSERQPTVYIRGSEGLAEAYKQIREETLSGLAYIGEWHSHPDGCPCSPSDDDFEAGIWLAEQTRPTSLPGILLIVGEEESTCWMLCSRTNELGAPVHLTLTRGS